MEITEKLLQYVWQFQSFNRQDLQLKNGQPFRITKPGKWNHHQGPDFVDALVVIEDVQWAGNVEIHIMASDWNHHGHGGDKQYDNVILHVVWKCDTAVFDKHGNEIPVFEMAERIPKALLAQYQTLMKGNVIPCQEANLGKLNALSWLAWKERLVAERLTRKSAHIMELYEQSNHHWEEVFWWTLASNFGMKVNSALFEDMARRIPLNLLAKHKNQIHKVEALLMGQANLLDNQMEEDYPQMLQKEYRFLQQKYQLSPSPIQPNFLRMRPANFPTVRLAQLAMLIHQSTHLFSVIKETNEIDQLRQLFGVTANDYWHYHYRFNQTTAYQPKQIGNSSINNLIINSIAPILFAYGSHHKNESLKEKAVYWLTITPKEENQITKQWKNYGEIAHTAFDSQALIELTNNYCTKKRCLDCALGNKILTTAWK